jgi:ribonuclease D
LAKAEIDFKSQTTRKKQTFDYSDSDIKYPELFELLKTWRSEQAKQEDVAHFQILHQRVIIQIVIILPDSLSALKNIKGVGKRTVEKYGVKLVTMISDFCQKNKIEPNQLLPAPQATKKSETQSGDTKKSSYDLYQSGKTIEQIAQQRGFVKSTIENHLAWYIGRGELDILNVISAEKLSLIKEKLSELNTDNLKEVKVALGDDYSYGEINMVKESIKNTNDNC